MAQRERARQVREVRQGGKEAVQFGASQHIIAGIAGLPQGGGPAVVQGLVAQQVRGAGLEHGSDLGVELPALAGPDHRDGALDSGPAVVGLGHIGHLYHPGLHRDAGALRAGGQAPPSHRSKMQASASRTGSPSPICSASSPADKQWEWSTS